MASGSRVPGPTSETGKLFRRTLLRITRSDPPWMLAQSRPPQPAASVTGGPEPGDARTPHLRPAAPQTADSTFMADASCWHWQHRRLHTESASAGACPPQATR